MRQPSVEAPVPVFYVLEMYQDTFRLEKPAVKIRTAGPLSLLSVGDYLYEVSFQIHCRASRSYFTGGGKAACDFNTRKGSSEAHHECLRKSGSHSRGLF
jgi:hypothetical protein